MTDGIYIGMTGAVARAAQLDAIADNLANAETPGFREARPRFESFLPPVEAELQTGIALVGAPKTAVDTRAGPVKATGRNLDIRVDGDRYLSITMEDGRIGYTRDGRLQLDGEGRLLASGRPVLGRGGPIAVPSESDVQIDAEGRVLVDGSAIDQLSFTALSGPIERLGPTVVAPDREPDPATGQIGRAESVEARVHTGELEGSNASALDQSVLLIQAQRAYEFAMQSIQTSRRLDEKASELGRIRG